MPHWCRRLLLELGDRLAYLALPIGIICWLIPLLVLADGNLAQLKADVGLLPLILFLVACTGIGMGCATLYHLNKTRWKPQLRAMILAEIDKRGT